jgi:hypothetical protein
MSNNATEKLWASIYRAAANVYLAVLSDGRQIQRGSLDYLAKSLFLQGIGKDCLLFGDWREGAELLPAREQDALQYELRQLEAGDADR